MRNPFSRDLVLLHPPAIYDFRTRETFLGPVADAVPSTTMFEMYPVGMTSLAEFLERNHGARPPHGRHGTRAAVPRRARSAAAAERNDLRTLLPRKRRLLRASRPQRAGVEPRDELESPDEQLRRVNGKFPWPNAVVEGTIARALAHGCRTIDVFFMVGLPHQRAADALAIPDYCEHLIQRFGRRLRPFVAPLGPFLDPGSRAFEQPEFGYRRLCSTLEDHRRALLNSDWQHILSYETDAMTRDEIVRTTYDVAERLNDIKHRHHVIDAATFSGVEMRLRAARELLAAGAGTDALSHAAFALANHGTMFGDDELKWPVRHGFRVGATLLKNLATGLVLEIGHTAARMAGRYDCACGNEELGMKN